MGVEVDAGTGLPLLRLVEVLVDVVVLPYVAREEDEERAGKAALAATGDKDEGEAEEGGSREAAVCVVGVLETPVGEGRIGREYVRSAAVVVEVSLGGAGTRTCGDGVLAVAPASLGRPRAADTEGAGVRGGGGEEVVGVSVDAGESKSMGLGVSRGGVGVAGVEQSGVVVVGALVPLVASPCSDWLCRTSSLSILQRCRTLKQTERSRRAAILPSRLDG